MQITGFIKRIFEFFIGENVEINKVQVERQWNKVDIAITINDKYFIIEEVNVKEYGNQLERYEKEAE